MEHPGFFHRAGPFPIEAIAKRIEAEVAAGADGSMLLQDVRPLGEAQPQHLSFIDNRKYAPLLETTRTGACIASPALAARVPKSAATLISKSPYRSFALALHLFYPEAGRPLTAMTSQAAGDGPIHPTASIEDGAVIEPGAVVGREALIGRGARIAAGAVVGFRVHVGRDSYVGPGATLVHCLIGDRVIVHAGARLGQDGFGFAMSPRGHIKVPQVGRVIIHDDVEIGANTTIDRGALKDTIIGEGTKIDNLVQIGHNVVLGRHCVIVAQVGISGSTEIGDFVVMGGQAGAVGHVRIGNGAQIAGGSHVKDDVPPGARMGGTPAVPFRTWARQIAAVKRLAQRGSGEAETDVE